MSNDAPEKVYIFVSLLLVQGKRSGVSSLKKKQKKNSWFLLLEMGLMKE